MSQWKRTAAFLLLVFLLFARNLTVAMADLRDDCDSAAGPGSYQNLSLPEKDFIRWDSPPDGSYLVQASNSQRATAVYSCPGAERVTVAVYSRHGSFVSWEGETLVRGGEDLPLQYDPSGGEIYCQGRRMVYDAEDGTFLFTEEDEVPSRLEHYGLSIAASSDGTAYFKVPRTLLSASREDPDAYWYEVYEAELEEGTRFLRLTLTDQSSIEIIGREGRHPFETVGGLSLASVEIIGTEADESGSGGGAGNEGTSPPGGSGNETEENGPPEDDYPEEDFPEIEEYWEEGILWFDPEEWTDALPNYILDEELAWEAPFWGPEQDPYAGPAFPEEDPEQSEASEAPAESPSSQSAGKSGKNASSGKASPSGDAEEEPEEAGIIPVRLPDWERRSGTVPLWRRVTEPDIVTVLLMSASLIVSGLRILWGRRLEGERRQSNAKNEE